MSYENRELTKKVLNALDPKYISSQDQQEKITSVFKRFRDKEEDNEEAVEELATAGLERLSSPEKKKGFFQRRAEAARQTRKLGDRYNRQAARGTMGSLVPFGDYERKKQYRTTSPLKYYNPDKENKELPSKFDYTELARRGYKGLSNSNPSPSTAEKRQIKKTPPQPRSILQRIGMNKESREKRATKRAQKAKNENKFLKNMAERGKVTPEEADRRRKILLGDSNQPTSPLATEEQQQKDEVLRKAWQL
jgi:hypothetical protein